MKNSSILVAIFTLATAAMTQAATVTFTLDLNPTLGTYKLLATSSPGDNFGIAAFDVTLTGAILTADHRTPNGLNLFTGDDAGMTLLRSADNDTNGEGFNIGAAQNTVDPTPHLIYGYGQSAGNMSALVPNYFNIGTADTIFTAPFLIANGTYNTAGTTPGFGLIFDTLANVFIADGSPDVVAATVVTQVIPEPSSALILGAGVLLFGARRRRNVTA